jgi:hypothetical protein
MQEYTMSRGQRGNKEAKKPKKAQPAADRSAPVLGTTPVLPGVVSHPFKRR